MLIKTIVSLGLILFCVDLYGSTGQSWGTPSSSSTNTNTRYSTQRKAQKERAKKKSVWVDVTKSQRARRANTGGGGPRTGVTNVGGGGGTNVGARVGYTPPNYQPFHIDSLLSQVGGFETSQATGQCRNAVDQAKTKVNSANEKIQQARIALLSALQVKNEATSSNINVQKVCRREGGISSVWDPGHRNFSSEEEAQQYLQYLQYQQQLSAMQSGMQARRMQMQVSGDSQNAQ